MSGYQVISALSQVEDKPRMPWRRVEHHLDKGIFKALGATEKIDRDELRLAWREWSKVNWLH